MIRTAMLLAISMFSFSSFGRGSNDGGRDFGFTGGFGVSKQFSSIQTASNTSNFEGWSPNLEIGVDIPWSRKSGVFFSAELRQLDLTNKSDSAVFIEKAEGSSGSAKLGFFYGKIGFGGGVTQNNIKVRQVSTQTGGSSSTIKGQTNLLFLNYNLNIQKFYRLSFEAENNAGNLGEYKFSNLGATMKFTFLFDP